MQVYRKIPVDAPKCVLALGNFDGVHVAHRQLLTKGLETARKTGVVLSVLLLDPHPMQVLFPDRKIKLLTTLDERLHYFEEIGVDQVFVLPFTHDFAALTPQAFIEQIVLQLSAVHVIVGFNYTFGVLGRGKVDDLQFLGKRFGFKVTVCQAQLLNGKIISSTYVRKALLNGDIHYATQLLGRAPVIRGFVVQGEKRGRLLGFPTANIRTPEYILIPKNGVYAVWSEINGQVIYGMMNIGTKPTFHQKYETTIEVNFFDVQLDLYGRKTEIHIKERIRDEQKFAGLDELKAQLSHDENRAREILVNH